MAEIYGIEFPDVPDNLRPMSALLLLDMVDEDLESMIHIVPSGDLKSSQIIGLLRAATLVMEHRFVHGDQEE